MKSVGLYIHIPFCVRKCRYCDFLSAPLTDRSLMRDYMKALLQEISFRAGRDIRIKKVQEPYPVHSVFIGGGTPSLMGEEHLTALMQTIREYYILLPDAEITIEANPGTLTREFLASAKAAGVNRLSLGLQSAQDQELGCLGRIHTFGDFLDSFRMARDAGFENINIDLMCGIPGQTPESFRKTLETVLDLNCEHISAYELILEPGTPFYEAYQNDRDGISITDDTLSWARPLPGEDMMIEMDTDLKHMLSNAGYKRYEISNYAKEGKACRHNIGYWQRKPYLGFGTGAAGLIDHIRTKNETDTDAYIRFWQEVRQKDTAEVQTCFCEVQELTVSEEMEEFMFLGLRMCEGITSPDFSREFGADIETVYGSVLSELSVQSLLSRESLSEGGERICLTQRGMDLGNYCMSRFLL